MLESRAQDRSTPRPPAASSGLLPANSSLQICLPPSRWLGLRVQRCWRFPAPRPSASSHRGCDRTAGPQFRPPSELSPTGSRRRRLAPWKFGWTGSDRRWRSVASAVCAESSFTSAATRIGEGLGLLPRLFYGGIQCLRVSEVRQFPHEPLTIGAYLLCSTGKAGDIAIWFPLIFMCRRLDDSVRPMRSHPKFRVLSSSTAPLLPPRRASYRPQSRVFAAWPPRRLAFYAFSHSVPAELRSCSHLLAASGAHAVMTFWENGEHEPRKWRCRPGCRGVGSRSLSPATAFPPNGVLVEHFDRSRNRAELRGFACAL